MNLRLEHPRALVGFLFGIALALAALLEYDNRVLDQAIVELRYCAQAGGLRRVSLQLPRPPSRAPASFPAHLTFQNERWAIIHRPPPNVFGLLRGLTLCKQRIIYVSADEQERDTLLHELLHLSFGCAIDEGGWNQITYTEEDAVQHITPNLLRILEDNPHLAAYLVRGF